MTTNLQMTVAAYHATDPARVPAILDDGFRLDAPVRSDPGDFGRAVYFTTHAIRARAIGRAVLKAVLVLESPLRLSASDAYALVIDRFGFDTIHGHGDPASRHGEAERARAHFVGLGHDALVVEQGFMDYEIALYVPERVRHVEVWTPRQVGGVWV